MKLIENDYKIKNPKITDNIRVVSITDIHSNPYFMNIIKELISINPDLIIVSGDTIDSIDNSNNDLIIDAFRYLGNNIPTFISYGNHDTVTFISYSNHDAAVFIREEVDTHNEEFFDKLKRKTNCIVLDNNSEEFKNLIIKSFNLPTDSWYQLGEQKDLFIEEFNKNYKPDNSRYTILSSHSPNGYLTNKGKISEELDNSLLDTLILSGHNHGGLVPRQIQNLLKNTPINGIGLVGPYSKLLFRNAYGYYSSGRTNLIISNGITKWSDCNGDLGKIVNRVLLPEIEVITLANGEDELKYNGYKVKKLTR